MKEESARVVYSGLVQGVGFRFTARDLSRRYNVRGWVRNLSDGRVELLAEGSSKNLKMFLNALQDEFKNAITNISITVPSESQDFKEFQIRM